MRIIYTTDLHGIEWKYDRLLEIAKGEDIGAVVNGGDMLPKQGDLFRQGDFIEGCLADFFKELSNDHIWHLGYLGNDDLRIFDQLFDKTCKAHPYIENLAQSKVKLGGYEFIGMNCVTDYPFRLKDRCRMDSTDFTFQEQHGTGLLSTMDGMREIEDWFSYAGTIPTIEDELQRLPEPENMKKSIYVIHMPPCKLGLDVCYNGKQVGSKAVYEFLEEKQPRLALHGHIHESPNTSKIWNNEIGKTICVQPGQTEFLSYVIIDLDEMTFQREVVY